MDNGFRRQLDSTLFVESLVPNREDNMDPNSQPFPTARQSLHESQVQYKNAIANVFANIDVLQARLQEKERELKLKDEQLKLKDKEIRAKDNELCDNNVSLNTADILDNCIHALEFSLSFEKQIGKQTGWERYHRKWGAEDYAQSDTKVPFETFLKTLEAEERRSARYVGALVKVRERVDRFKAWSVINRTQPPNPNHEDSESEGEEDSY